MGAEWSWRADGVDKKDRKSESIGWWERQYDLWFVACGMQNCQKRSIKWKLLIAQQVPLVSLFIYALCVPPPFFPFIPFFLSRILIPIWVVTPGLHCLVYRPAPSAIGLCAVDWAAADASIAQRRTINNAGHAVTLFVSGYANPLQGGKDQIFV